MKLTTRKMKNTQPITVEDVEDIYLSAALVCNGRSVHSVDEVAPGRFAFSFEVTPKQEQLVSDYWNGAMRVEPRQFANAIRDLKARTKMRFGSF